MWLAVSPPDTSIFEHGPLGFDRLALLQMNGLIVEGVRARVGQPSIYNSCRFSFKYVLSVLIEQTGKEL